jgi:uncharacterized membrane protein
MSETALSRQEAPPLENRLASVRARVRVERGEDAVALRIVCAGTVLYAALFASAAIVHWVVFKEARFDLGNMAQAVWNTLHGHFLETTTATGHQRDRLGFHVDPFLLLFAPLLWVWSNPVLLPVIQAFAVASGALPVFWLARKHLGSSRTAAHFAFAYLLYPATQFNAFTIAAGFHAVSFAIPLLLYAIWFLDEDRLAAFSVLALLACTTKEEIPLAVGCLGVWAAVRKGRRLFGLSVFAAGLALTLFNFLWLIPHFSPSGIDPYSGRYRGVGGTPQGMAHKLFTDPIAFVHAVASGHKGFYLALLLIPFLGLWLFEPLLFLGAVPDLAINLLSSKPDQTLVGYQYTAGIVPFVVAASIFGATRFPRRAAGLSLAVFACAAAVAIYSPIYLGAKDLRAIGTPLVAAKAHALSLIPSGVPVAASNELGGHLSQRRYIYEFPYVRRAHWIVVDINDITQGDTPAYKQVVRNYERNRAWRTVFSSHGITVLHKRRATGP